MARMSGYSYQKLVERSTYHKLPPEWTGMWNGYIIHYKDNVYSGSSEIEMPESFWMQIIMHWNTIVVVNNDYVIRSIQW